MAKKSDVDKSWRPKSKGDRCRNRGRDKYRDNYDRIFRKEKEDDNSHRHTDDQDRP